MVMVMSWKGVKWTKPYLDSGIMIIANHKLLYRKAFLSNETRTFIVFVSIDDRVNRFFILMCESCSDDGHCTFRDLFSFGRLHWHLLSESQSVDDLCNSTMAAIRIDYFNWIPLLPTTSCSTLPKAQVFLDQRVHTWRSTGYSECCKCLLLSLCSWLSNVHTLKIPRSNLAPLYSCPVVAIDH